MYVLFQDLSVESLTVFHKIVLCTQKLEGVFFPASNMYNLTMKCCTGIIPFSDRRQFSASPVSGVVCFMVEGRVGSVKG